MKFLKAVDSKCVRSDPMNMSLTRTFSSNKGFSFLMNFLNFPPSLYKDKSLFSNPLNLSAYVTTLQIHF